MGPCLKKKHEILIAGRMVYEVHGVGEAHRIKSSITACSQDSSIAMRFSSLVQTYACVKSALDNIPDEANLYYSLAHLYRIEHMLGNAEQPKTPSSMKTLDAIVA